MFVVGEPRWEIWRPEWAVKIQQSTTCETCGKELIEICCDDLVAAFCSESCFLEKLGGIDASEGE